MDAGSRLVENQHFRLVQACGGKLKPLSDAKRQTGRTSVGGWDEIEARQRFCYPARDLGRRDAVQPRVQHEVRAHASS